MAAHYVSPTGTATWAGSIYYDTPCSLALANANAAAGDTVYLQTGTYTAGTGFGIICPQHAGSAGSVIHYTKAVGATPVIQAGSGLRAILIQGQDYIKVSGLTFTDCYSFFHLGNGADYNEISECAFDGSPSYYTYSLGLITWKTTAGSGLTASTHNWIHHCTFTQYGRIASAQADDGTIRINSGDDGDLSYYNTVEDCVFSYGGHDCLSVVGKYNVIRNNVLHNEEAFFATAAAPNYPTGYNNTPTSGYFGDRCLLVETYRLNCTRYNLLEGNRCGYAGTPPDDDGANGIENAGREGIVRYNVLYGNGCAGYYSKSQNGDFSDNNRVYNNTIYANGYGDADLAAMWKYGICMSNYTTSLVYVTNDGNNYTCILTHLSSAANEPGTGATWETYWVVGGPGGTVWSGSGIRYIPEPLPKNNVFKNNIVYGNAAEHNVATAGGLNTYTQNLTANPSFLSTDMSDKTSLTEPTLAIGAGSAALDGGAALTTTTNSGAGATSLTVADALYFQAGSAATTTPMGSSLSNIAGDWVAVGTVTNFAQIADINYATNTITLASPLTWTSGQDVWLYMKSDGDRVLYGSAPDYGAFEYQPTLSATILLRTR